MRKFGARAVRKLGAPKCPHIARSAISLQTTEDYFNEFKETVKWINGTEYELSSKTLIKQFIKGVNPAQLEVLEIESFPTLEDRFNDIYYEHHERLEKLITVGCVLTGPSDKNVSSWIPPTMRLMRR